MSSKRVVVIGGNLAGLTALELKHLLGQQVAVTVISKGDQFLFVPSLIWVMFGKRQPKDITFGLAPVLKVHGVEFVFREATRVDTAAQQVHTNQGSYAYDYLVIASGFNPQFDVVPGMDPGKDSYYCIASLEQALKAHEGWKL
jgi:NADH dehydrogenase FAD-containing subunit